MPQAGTAASNKISQGWNILTVTEKSELSEKLVDAPSGDSWSVGCCQENVKSIGSDLVVNIQSEQRLIMNHK